MASLTSLGSLVPRRSLLTRCSRKVWSLGDVTAHGSVQDWSSRDGLGTRLPTKDFKIRRRDGNENAVEKQKV